MKNNIQKRRSLKRFENAKDLVNVLSSGGLKKAAKYCTAIKNYLDTDNSLSIQKHYDKIADILHSELDGEFALSDLHSAIEHLEYYQISLLRDLVIATSKNTKNNKNFTDKQLEEVESIVDNLHEKWLS